MPLLVVSQDAQLDRRFEFTDVPIRIGRDPLNDIVLDDDAHSVSRFHAEVRADTRGYRIVDLGSKNGTWMNGNAVTDEPLRPGTAVTLGPFTLVLQDTAASYAPQTTVPNGAQADGQYTVYIPPAQVPPPAPPPVPIDQHAQTSYRRASNRQRQAWLFAGTAALVAALLGVGYLLGNRDGGSREDQSDTSSAPTGVSSNTTSAPETTTSAPPVVLDVPPAPVTPPTAPANRNATTAPVNRAPRNPPGVPSAVIRRPNESTPELIARAERVRKEYGAAQDALAEDPAAAIAHLNEVEKEQPGYLDVQALLTQAHQKLRAQAQQAYDEGRRLEAASQWRPALQSYARAHQLDSSIAVDDRVAAIQAQMARAGVDAYRQARQLHAVGRTAQAAPLYQQAIELLPENSPEHKDAADRLRQIQSPR